VVKVAIIDFGHYEVVDALVRVLQPVCAELRLIVSKWIAEDLKSSRLDEPSNVFVHVVEGAGAVAAVQDILLQGNIDLCVFSTIDEEFEAYSVLLSRLRGKKLLVIHNLNFWLSKQRILGVFRVPRNQDHRAMLACIAEANAMVVLSSELKDYASRHYRLERPIIAFTTCISREPSVDTVAGERNLRVVIPGQIEAKRRDYHGALDSLERLEPLTTEITLLGRPFDEYSDSVIGRCRLLAEKGFGITCYDSYVPQREFDRQMTRASVILSPIVAATSFAGVHEQYGASKISGAVPDMIRYGKPGILPTGISFPANLRSSIRTYASKHELTNILHDISDPGVMSRFAECARANSAHWKVSEVRAQFLLELQSAGIAL